MKRIVFLFSFFALQLTAFSQLGVGTNSPDASAQLDVTATDKGFLAPRIALTGATDVATIASPATGLMIYNTATAGTAPNNVLPGYYYYDGVKWVRLINGADASKWTNDPINSKTYLTNLSDGATLRTGDTNFVVTDNNILQIGNITNISGANSNDKAIVASKAGNNSISLTSDGGIYSAFGGQIYGGTSSGSAAYYTMTKYRGSAASPAVVQNGDLIGIIDFRGGTGVGSVYVNGARLITAVDGAVNTSLSPASIPMSFDFQTVAPNQTIPNSRLKISSNGNVGIGSATPTHKLQVVGNSIFTPRTSNDGITGEPVTIEFYGKQPTGTATQVGGIKMGWYNSFAGIEVLRGGGASGAGLGFNYADNSGTTFEGMRLMNNGFLGIGTLSPVSTLSNTTLQIQGSNFTNAINGGLTWVSPGTGFVSSFYNSVGNGLLVKIAGTSASSHAFEVSTGTQIGTVSSPLFSIRGNGTVGINVNAVGNATPLSTLHIVNPLLATNTINADASVLRLARPINSGVKWDNIAQFNLGSYSTGGSAQSRLDLTMNNLDNVTFSNVMTWQANGNVGIGITAPTQSLDVNGRVRIRTIDTGVATDSVLVVNGGVVKRVSKGASVNIQTADYTLTASDNGNIVIMNSATAVTITVPATLPAGFVVQIIQKGAGQVTVSGSGSTINSANGFKTRVTNSAIGVVMESSTVGYVTGDSNF